MLLLPTWPHLSNARSAAARNQHHILEQLRIFFRLEGRRHWRQNLPLDIQVDWLCFKNTGQPSILLHISFSGWLVSFQPAPMLLTMMGLSSTVKKAHSFAQAAGLSYVLAMHLHVHTK